MARYYFDWHEGEKLISDDDGCELADFEAVKAEAQQALGERASALSTANPRRLGIEVRDQNGKAVLRTFAWFLRELP